MVSKGSSAGVFNSLPWERLEVIQTQEGADKPSLGMLNMMCIFDRVFLNTSLYHGSVMSGSAALVKVPSIGYSPVKDTQPVTPVSVTVQVGKTT